MSLKYKIPGKIYFTPSTSEMIERNEINGKKLTKQREHFAHVFRAIRPQEAEKKRIFCFIPKSKKKIKSEARCKFRLNE